MSRTTPVLALAIALGVGPAPAAEQTDPLRFVPERAGFVLEIANPRHVAEAVAGTPAVRDAAALSAVRELIEGTALRRGTQLLAYVERETGTKWPELLDKVAGGGMAIAVAYGSEPNPVLLVVRGTDEAACARSFDLFVRVLEEELARRGSPDPVVRKAAGKAEVVAVGRNLHFARVGATLFASNRADALTSAVGLATAGREADSVLARPTLAAARVQLGKDPLARFWLDFDSVKETKEAKDFFENSKKELVQTLVLGGTIDCLRRSKYVAGALFREGNGFRFALRLPAGRDGFPPEFALHAPADGKPGSLPFLEPPGVLYSQSFYLDLAALWKDRERLVNAQVRRDFEKAERDISKVVPGLKFGELLSLWGAHHRFVVANVDAAPYKSEPGQKLPAFGYVATMRDPQFGKSVEGLIRGAGFVFSLQHGLKAAEQVADGVKVVSYRFPEGRPLSGDDADLRYNFEPSFAVAGDQFVLASTAELAKKLVAEVRRTERQATSAEVWRGRAYALGAANALAASPDAAVSESVLRQAVGLAEARTQVENLIAYLRTLGTFDLAIDEAAAEYRLDLAWKTAK